MILIGGENLIDFIQIENGKPAALYQANTGGAPYNCAKALGRQGIKTGYLTPISVDSLGDMLANSLHECGVSLLAPRDEKPTSLAVVSIVNSMPSYQFYRENTAERQITLEGLRQLTPDAAKALYLGSLALTGGADADIWATYFCETKARGLFTALDPNIRAAFIHDRTGYLARLDTVLKNTDLLKLSDEDLEWLFPDTHPTDAAEKLLAQSTAKMLIVTLGDKGAFALSGGMKTTIKPAQVDGLKDTVGAGDTFMATLLSRLDQLDALSRTALAGFDESAIKDLLTWAATAAALNCEKDGCHPPNANTLKARMA